MPRIRAAGAQLRRGRRGDAGVTYVDPQTLEEEDVALVYIAGKTSEAQTVEAIFTDNGMTYTVKPTPFLRSTLFGGMMELPGVGFYVPRGQAEQCRGLLQGRRFRVGLVMDGEE
jgi:hypothetical protein